MAEPKTKENDLSVKAFLDAIEDERRRRDCWTVVDLMRKVTKVDAKMWGTNIVGFGRYLYTYASGRSGEWPVVAFSPRKNDLTLYLRLGASESDQLLSKLGKHKVGKGCLYLKKLEDVDMAVLEALVKQSVEAKAPQRVDR